MNGDRQRLRGHYDEDFYWERVDRNLGWLGDTSFAASWRLFDLVLPTLLDRSYRTWGQDLSKRTYFGHPPAEASLESRV